MLAIPAHERRSLEVERLTRMSTKELRDRQLQLCCDALAEVQPTAMTLCTGWSAHDVAIHLWLIKREPLAWPGMVTALFAGLTRRRADLVRTRWSYQILVDKLRLEPGAIACMPLDRYGDNLHSLGEYYVHTQDVARPAAITQPVPDEQLQEALWSRTQAAAHKLQRRLPEGLVLQHLDGRSALVGHTPVKIVVSSMPSELICWVYGRRTAASVTISKHEMPPDHPTCSTPQL